MQSIEQQFGIGLPLYGKLLYEVIIKDGKDIGLFITLVPKVL